MDIGRLLQSLLDHKVKFLVIGAWALPAYGHERTTRDIDVFIEPTEPNAKRALVAVKDVGYDVEDLTVRALLEKKTLFRQYILQMDIHPFVAGVTFEQAWKKRKKANIKGCKVWVPSLDDLIRMKAAAGRARDELDLEVLQEIRKQLKKRTRGKQSS
jgi:predicted nucleotidyltransferase